MTTLTIPRPTRRENPHTEVHVYCRACHPDAKRSICSAALRGEPADDEAVTCAVCDDLADLPCPECGAP